MHAFLLVCLISLACLDSTLSLLQVAFPQKDGSCPTLGANDGNTCVHDFHCDGASTKCCDGRCRPVVPCKDQNACQATPGAFFQCPEGSIVAGSYCFQSGNSCAWSSQKCVCRSSLSVVSPGGSCPPTTVHDGTCPVSPFFGKKRLSCAGMHRSCLTDGECASNAKCCNLPCQTVCHKPGVCPKSKTFASTDAACDDECSNDGDCSGSSKCCYGVEKKCRTCSAPYSPPPKDGGCPANVPKPTDAENTVVGGGFCQKECTFDEDCPGTQKCCGENTNCGGGYCVDAVSVKPGMCPADAPVAQPGLVGACDFQCNVDADCAGDKKCCGKKACGGGFCLDPVVPNKPGECPDDAPVEESGSGGGGSGGGLVSTCQFHCAKDADCEGDKKCCGKKACGGGFCLDPKTPPVEKPGTCPADAPVAEPGQIGICIHECSTDSDCDGAQKCCGKRACGGGYCLDPTTDDPVNNDLKCPQVIGSVLCSSPSVNKCENDAMCADGDKCCGPCGKTCKDGKDPSVNHAGECAARATDEICPAGANIPLQGDCRFDDDCETTEKCCFQNCRRKCVAQAAPTPSQCPPDTTTSDGAATICLAECSTDADCKPTDDNKPRYCCSNGCHRKCVVAYKPPDEEKPKCTTDECDKNGKRCPRYTTFSAAFSVCSRDNDGECRWGPLGCKCPLTGFWKPDTPCALPPPAPIKPKGGRILTIKVTLVANAEHQEAEKELLQFAAKLCAAKETECNQEVTCDASQECKVSVQSNGSVELTDADEADLAAEINSEESFTAASAQEADSSSSSSFVVESTATNVRATVAAAATVGAIAQAVFT